MEQILHSMFASAPFFVSFLAGVLTFISPCVLPLIPAYISYISGMSIKHLKSDESITKEHRFKILKASLMFVLGFSIVFITLGAVMANLVSDIFNYEWITWIAGGIIVLFGLHITGLISIRFLNFEQRLIFGETKPSSWFAPFILGLSFALGWTPCVGPIFAAIVALGANDPTNALTLMSIYALGLAVPFILTALLTTSMFSVLNRIKNYFRIIEIVSGIMLICIGLLIATGKLNSILS